MKKNLSHQFPVLVFVCVVLSACMPACAAGPEAFARLDLNQSQTYKQMTVGTVDTIDSMNLSLSRISLLTTFDDDSDIKRIPLPSVRNVRRIFSSTMATWQGNTLTILGPADSTVSWSGLNEYTIFIRAYLPVVWCRVPGAMGDVFLVKVNASARPTDITSLISSTEIAYLLHTKGVVAIEPPHNRYTAYGSGWSSSDFDSNNLSYTLQHNEIDVSSFILNRSVARQVSNISSIYGIPPPPGEYLLHISRYYPQSENVTTYSAWPVLIQGADNNVVITPFPLYNQRSGQNITLTFTDTSQINNITYLLIKEGETYDAQVNVNMSAVEDAGSRFGPELIIAGNPFFTILKNPAVTCPELEKVISYSITRVGSPPPPPQPPWPINITPGYGISGYALHSQQANIPSADLQGLVKGTFSVYALGLNAQNEVVALDRDAITVGKSPAANFAGTPLSGPAPLPVQFTDTSTDDPTSWSWNFGDGSTNSTQQHPSHTFQNPGNFTVTLTASNIFGSSTEQKTAYVNVTAPGLQAGFTADPTIGFVPLFVQFTDTSTGPHDQWNWNFGDGSTNSTQQHPSHTYSQVGSYTVTLTVRSGAGTPSTAVRPGYITVMPVPPAPVAEFTANVTTGDAPLTVQFTDQSTGSPYEWNWTFGDGGHSAARNPVHTYNDPGNYTVSLTVRGLGGIDTETKPDFIHVLGHPPVAGFTANVTSGQAPLPVQFTDTSTGGPDSWSWSFGDSGISSAWDPVHVYTGAGNFTVSLTVSNAFGSDTLSRPGYINVSGPAPGPGLHADFVAAPREGYEPLLVQFADISTGNPISWNWSFGDGINSTGQSPNHTYRSYGTYAVALTVSNGTASDTLSRSAYIQVYRRSSGGGGGGGGGSSGVFLLPTTTTPTTSPTPTQPPSSSGALPLGSDGRTTQPVSIESADGMATLSLAAGVKVTGDEGQPVYEVSISSVADSSLPPLPGNPTFGGYAVQITPLSVQFDPEGTLILSFSPDQWSALSESNPVLMWYNRLSGTWVPLDTTIDTTGRTVRGKISAGGTYALFVQRPHVNSQTTSPGAVATTAPAGLPPIPLLLLAAVVVIIVIAALGVYLFKIRPSKENPAEENESYDSEVR